MSDTYTPRQPQCLEDAIEDLLAMEETILAAGRAMEREAMRNPLTHSMPDAAESAGLIGATLRAIRRFRD